MIRQLTIEELPITVQYGKQFFDEGKMPGGFNPDHFISAWQNLIRSGVGVIFGMFSVTGEFQGALGAVHFPDMFNGHKVAVENFWYISPQFRGRGGLLLREFERWAKSIGCKRVCMIHLQALQPEKLKEFYERLGYQHIESNYVKIF